MRVERELMRGAGPVAVLQLLRGREMYGYELVETLQRRTEGVLDMGESTLYPMLYNLEAKGYISSRRRRSEAGRERKYYALTRKGSRRLARESAQWRSLVEAMSALGVIGDGVPGSALLGASP